MTNRIPVCTATLTLGMVTVISSVSLLYEFLQGMDAIEEQRSRVRNITA